MKIICVGLPKTGTTSLKKALQILGYNAIGWSTRAAQLYHDRRFDVLYNEYMTKFDAFTDAPWSLMYKIFDGMFDDCRFIMTNRIYDKIYKSLKNHILSKKENNLGLVYPFSDVINEEQEMRIYFNNHDVEVGTYFYHRCDCLNLWIPEGDGWGKLCKFLDKSIPYVPFPHVNKGTEFNPDYKQCQNQ